MAQATDTQGNPAVVGLAGFGVTTLVLQFHNVGWCGMGPVFALALMFGGLAQLIAGFQEFKCGNNFGYSAFVAYGAFWMAFGVILICNHLDVYKSSHADVGFFLIGYTVYTFIMWIPAMRIHGMMALTFTLLLIGFLLLDIGHFGYPILNVIAGYELMACALCALYMMAAAIYAQVFGREILPLGKPWITLEGKEEAAVNARLATEQP
ncbi:acetate uptake transporter [Coraliomargarita akajimensis]|uniref:GPR1/FUN34/yaaH family protein n=1 Tax=Coraliomargarita akajimensis (strain DSM 45221 / IAM 15411 / JCM 23193 / KCTC 12865 / 04OKA010-24) TaxID=583355 RepID=D5EJ23_CORAD|nr:GPR1/FUN34/YaaH family transporter [Coraliomargarita akajimensis]ADE54422.1 GPR1/FUN34/yaaH family protein [Coraliomargarita akajimensis DSM 45221]